MEPDIKAFLILVMQSIAITLLWMLVNMTAGIYYNLAFPEDHLTVWNILFYLFFCVSLTGLLLHLRSRWKDFREPD